MDSRATAASGPWTAEPGTDQADQDTQTTSGSKSGERDGGTAKKPSEN